MIELLARVLSGDRAAPVELGALDANAVAAEAERHGIASLLVRQLSAHADAAPALTALLGPRAERELFLDLLREGELKIALTALDRAGTAPLVVKGTHLAYVHYAAPTLRPRLDTDVLIRPSQQDTADTVLKSMGYIRQGSMSGELVSHQALYGKLVENHPISVLDIHWKIANTQVFANALTHDELTHDAVFIPQLGPAARAPSNIHALLLACMHRIAHHRDTERLIWLYDIHLLSASLTDAEWHAFANLAADREMVAVCRRSLERTQERFGTALPASLEEHPRWRMAGRELSANYLAPRAPILAIADDLRALPGWRARVRLLREHLFPPAPYMRTVYAPSSRAPLAILHARRLMRGARKWLRVGG